MAKGCNSSYFSRSRPSYSFSSLISSKNQPSGGFHFDLISMVAVASRIVSRASCERRPTSRNVTSDIHETKCMLRRRERDRSRGHRDRIVNWLPMRLLRCAARSKNSKSEKFSRCSSTLAYSESSQKLFLNFFFSCSRNLLLSRFA